ncbi:MAG TPA: PPC domain-containing DNA-binding protein [bacterium]|nr:PPC domain-containing DNA-binding protein [bacterium]
MDATNVKRVVVRRLVPGGDLLEELNKLVKAEGIEVGALSGIGALRKAAVGIFDVEKKEYIVNKFDEEMEICALTGNVSLKEGEPFVHAHLALSSRQGRGFGGHIMPGCEIFVAEVILWELEGARLERRPREDCGGLALWAAENIGTE